ncbi:MAG: ArsR family transcriptional regulator, partial [Geodermatophilaceae bacterium]|nr:ArsR family transcriptional regulator [Geodermatophilaceae bacterium]
EVPYLATGKSWLMEVGEPPSRDHMLAAFLEEVAAVGELNLDSSRLGLRLTVDEFEEFKTGLGALLDYWARRPATPGGKRWSVYVGIHPEEV